MKLRILLCMAVLLLFSACSDTPAASVSTLSETPVISSLNPPVSAEHPSSCEPPESNDEPSAQPVTVLPEYVPLEKLPADYSTEDALADGVIVLVHGEYEGNNHHLLPVFLQQVLEGKAAKIRIKEYTIEGDPLYRDLEYLPEEHCYLVTFDSTRDEFSASKEIYSRKYAWLWIQPPQTEDPQYYNSNTYLSLSCWKTPESIPEEQYPFRLLPIPDDILAQTAALAEQLSCDCADVQRIFDPNHGMEARLYTDGTVSVISENEQWNIKDIAFSFSYLDWNDDGCLLFMDGEDIIASYYPNEIATCIGVPLKNE